MRAWADPGARSLSLLRAARPDVLDVGGADLRPARVVRHEDVLEADIRIPARLSHQRIPLCLVRVERAGREFAPDDV